MIPASQAVGYAWLCWGSFVLFVQSVGTFGIFKNFSSVPKKATSPSLKDDHVPHVTIIRPAKGLEPYLYECLKSTFQQTYPLGKFTIYFCVSSKDDAAYSVMRRVIDEFPAHDARLFIEEEDPLLTGRRGTIDNMGPNPKIRNLSNAYREAKGDIVWISDCNVWLSKNAAGHMVDHLCGYGPDGGRKKPCKLVHQLPIVVDTVSSLPRNSSETQALLSGSQDITMQHEVDRSIRAQGGGRLDEMFMSTTHAKFYAAINILGVAPCVVGKSTMFRKSQLDKATDPAQNPVIAASATRRPTGLDYFSHFICEDHLIGDLLWKTDFPGHKNHRLNWGDLVVQPVAGMSVTAYAARRVRWLRARKWTVLLATLVEPGIESLLCCFYLSFAITTVPWFHEHLGIAQTWGSMLRGWGIGVTVWMVLDRFISNRLHAGYSIDIDEDTPAFAQGAKRGGAERRPFGQWLLAWIGREVLALPIWTWAVLLGTTVNWKGKEFQVKSDMSVVAVDEDRHTANTVVDHATPKID
ncbi:ceramide glucosyltransferase [Truncatella angustata]|uniref:Ceramide glucosyltransferase n=1 Tax=Truncatella angustata TaxID=152316 RepID=A0A9P9A0F1_9PEZI|nr:ceramide glucosyltransferase [Truncatella angustata]KAH6658292.1 ceramide glucosyltransferase [Truncatella angustata]